MTRSPLHPDLGPAAGPRGVRRVAGMRLRGAAGPLPARVWWPATTTLGAPPPLLVFFPADGRVSAAAEALCRGLCAQTGVVVLAASYRSESAHP